jgi:hypothetical protein
MPVKTLLLPIVSYSILTILFFQNLFFFTPAVGVSAQGQPEQIELAGFHLISADEGWLRLGQHLWPLNWPPVGCGCSPVLKWSPG